MGFKKGTEEYKKYITTRRNNLLNNCKEDFKKNQLKLHFLELDELEKYKTQLKIGDKSYCKKCNKEIKINSNLLDLCRSCKMNLHKIIFYGSIENFKKIANENYKKNCLEKYGVDNPSKLNEVKNKVKQTKLEHNDGVLCSEETKNKRRQTCLKKYGVENPNQVKKFKNKIKQTLLKKYGNENYVNVEKCKQTKLERYGDENYNNSEKNKNTRFVKNDGKYFSEKTISEIQTKRKLKQEEITKKTKSTNKIKYGFENPMQNPEIAKKSIEHRKQSYPYPSEIHIKHLIESTLKKYGTFNHSVNYYYNAIFFDSSWELNLYIYLKDHKINFEYHPNTQFEYFKDNVKHFYLPDFKINEKFYEIKGPHLINENGILLDWKGNEEIEKTNCLKNNNVKILTYKDLQEVSNYIDNTYGKDYCRKFKYAKN